MKEDSKNISISNIAQYKHYKSTNQLKNAVIIVVLVLLFGVAAGVLERLSFFDIAKFIG